MGRHLQIEIAPWAEPVFDPHRFISIRGGRGSGKSHAVAQKGVLLMANLLPAYWPVHGRDYRWRIMSARAFGVQIEDSVKEAVVHYIHKYGLTDDFEIQTYRIVHRPTEGVMTFPGIERNIDSILSKEGFDVFWMEQSESLTAEQAQKILPTMRKKTAELWFTWNPHQRLDWCWQRFVDKVERDDLSLEVNWRDNPWWYETGLEEFRRRDEVNETPEIYAWIWEGVPNDGDAQTILPYATLKDCITAWEKGLAPEGGLVYAGLDLAEGGTDKCALVVAEGPTIRLVEEWPGQRGTVLPTAQMAWELCQPWIDRLVRIYYDGATPARDQLLQVGFRGIEGVDFGGALGGPEDIYEGELTNAELFARRNMQMGMALKNRADLTVRLLRGEDIDPWRCLFIPTEIGADSLTLSQWSQPVRRFNTTTGKWEMKKKGVDVDERSPDRFDGLCLAFAHETDGQGLSIW